MNMLSVRKFNLLIILLVMFTFTPASLLQGSAQAAMVESQMIDHGESATTLRQINEKKVKRALENKIVAQKLESRGLSAEEVSGKLSSMSDEQVHQMASLSDRIPAGGDATGVVIAVLVIVALVLLIIFLWKRI